MRQETSRSGHENNSRHRFPCASIVCFFIIVFLQYHFYQFFTWRIPTPYFIGTDEEITIFPYKYVSQFSHVEQRRIYLRIHDAPKESLLGE
jgi:hypothetical protein